MRRQFYEPQVGDTVERLELRGFPVSIGGTYVLLDDVVTALRAYAEANQEPAVGEAATWLVAGDRELHQRDPVDEIRAVMPDLERSADPLVNRVEVYPDNPDDPRPKYYARSCSEEGDILYTTNGSIDLDYVLKDAGERWPGAEVHLVRDFMVDTVWEEQDPGGIRSPHTKRRRPSPKRLFAGAR